MIQLVQLSSTRGGGGVRILPMPAPLNKQIGLVWGKWLEFFNLYGKGPMYAHRKNERLCASKWWRYLQFYEFLVVNGGDIYSFMNFCAFPNLVLNSSNWIGGKVVCQVLSFLMENEHEKFE